MSTAPQTQDRFTQRMVSYQRWRGGEGPAPEGGAVGCVLDAVRFLLAVRLQREVRALSAMQAATAPILIGGPHDRALE